MGLLNDRSEQLSPRRQRAEILLTWTVSVVAAAVAASANAFERLHHLAQQYDGWGLQEICSVVFFGGLGFTALTVRRSFHLYKAEKYATSLAHQDSLTGLPNRRLFTNRLNEELALRNDESCAVLLIDLDRFKPVNDRYGHPAGDAVLQEVARRLTALAPRGTTVARIGGDEFAIVAPARGGADHVLLLAKRVIMALAEPFTVGDACVQIGATVGVAIAPCDGATTGALLSAADQALYCAKRARRGTVQVFEAEAGRGVEAVESAPPAMDRRAFRRPAGTAA